MGRAPARPLAANVVTRVPVEGDVELGFGNTLYPGDYRTKASVDADAEREETNRTT